MSMCAGGCRRAAGRSGSRPRRSSGTTTATSVKAYWRQQVGYGEGETWLMAHHPEKFLDGHMLWRGRIYSPLPFVRSLWGTRINAGVWGTAAFPSVYRTDVHPFAFLPHSIWWQIVSFVLTLVGPRRRGDGRHQWAAALLLGSGLVGLDGHRRQELRVRAAVGRRLAARAASSGTARRSPTCISSSRSRASAGGIRGMLAPPEVALPPAEPQTSRGPRPSLREAVGAPAAAVRRVTEDRFWSETWTSADRVLVGSSPTGCAGRGPCARSRSTKGGPTIATSASSSDAGRGSTSARWSRTTGAAGRCCASARTCGRRSFGVLTAVGFGAALLVAASAGLSLALAAGGRRWPRGVTLLVIAFTAWRTAQATAIVRRGVGARHRWRSGMVRDASGAAQAPLIAPSMLRTYGLRSALIFVVMIVGARRRHVHAAGGGDRGPAGHRRARRATPATTGRRSRPGSTRPAASPSRRTATSTSPTRTTTSSAASTRELGMTTGRRQPHQTGFSGDNGPATRAQLDTPDGVAHRAGRRPHRRRFAQRPHPPRRQADRHHHDDRRDRARTATTATTSRRSRRH